MLHVKIQVCTYAHTQREVDSRKEEAVLTAVKLVDKTSAGTVIHTHTEMFRNISPWKRPE